MIFVGASALVAMAAQAPEALDVADLLDAARDRLCAPVALWDTVAGLCRCHMFSVESARDGVTGLRDLVGLQMVGLGARDYDMALQAYAPFGKGRHPAALNLGDCFACAGAKSARAALPCTGEDFTKTDIRIAGRQGWRRLWMCRWRGLRRPARTHRTTRRGMAAATLPT